MTEGHFAFSIHTIKIPSRTAHCYNKAYLYYFLTENLSGTQWEVCLFLAGSFFFLSYSQTLTEVEYIPCFHIPRRIKSHWYNFLQYSFFFPPKHYKGKIWWWYTKGNFSLNSNLQALYWFTDSKVHMNN